MMCGMEAVGLMSFGTRSGTNIKRMAHVSRDKTQGAWVGESPLKLENLPFHRAKMAVHCTFAGCLT